VSATDPHHATHQALHRTIEAVWRIESARVIAGLTRLTRDLDLAEDLAQEALVAAWTEREVISGAADGCRLGARSPAPSSC
jgi:DNA-directed RNA polymerase specialized sigma24 family protein